MEAVIESFLAGFPVLIAHFAVTVAMLAGAVTAYLWITPYQEIALIRAGNTAAAVALSGAILGLGIPLAFAMAASVNVWDILIWGLLALVLQLLAYRITALLLRDLAARIEKDEIGPALLLVSIQLAVAAINAAAVTG